MLRDVALFSALSDQELAALQAAAQRRSYLGRAVMLRAGGHADGLYVLLSGRARVIIDSGEAREFIVSVLSRNEYFGELGLIDPAPSPVSVESLEPCETLYIARDRMVECLHQNSEAAIQMLRVALARLREAHHKIEGLALMTVHGRVARVLLECGREANGEWHVDHGTEEIASMVGASREMVSRVLREMSEIGFLRREKRRLIVMDRSAVKSRLPRGASLAA